MNPTRVIALAGTLLLAACTDEIPVPTPPVVVAGRDIDTALADRIALVASGADSDGQVVRFEWRLVVAPDGSKATVLPKSATGEVAELLPAGTSGLFVISVVAVDDDGLRSEPDYMNVLLRPASQLAIELICESGCVEESGALIAHEDQTVALQLLARRGALAEVEWSATLTRDPADPLTWAPDVVAAGDRAEIVIPRVARDAILTVTAHATGEDGGAAVARLNLEVPDSLDELPTITRIRVRQAGQTNEIGPSTAVLPGDALHLEAEATDPNGDPFECVFQFDASSPVHQVPGATSCRATIYPLGSADGALRLTVGAVNTSRPGAGEPLAMELPLARFVLESGGPSVRAVAIDSAGRAVGAGDGGAFYTWSGGARRQFSTSIAGRPDGQAAAIGLQPGPTGFIGWAGSGEWSRVDLASGVAGSTLKLARSNPPGATRAMAAGSGGRVFAATDEGLIAYDPFGSLEQWRPALPDLTAVAVEPRAGGEGRVWYANASGVFYLPGERASLWPTSSAGSTATVVNGGVVTAIALSANTRDVWIGTGGASDPGETGAGLQLFAEALDPEGGAPSLQLGESFFTEEAGIRAIALEESGPYAGDAWIVAGEKLLRVSRAVQLDGQRVSVPIVVGGLPGGDASPRSVAVRPGGTRQVVVGTSQGLAGAPELP